MFFCSYVFKKTCSHVLSHLFCATCMRINDSLKHGLERLMHGFLHLREQKGTLLKPFPRFYIA